MLGKNGTSVEISAQNSQGSSGGASQYNKGGHEGSGERDRDIEAGLETSPYRIDVTREFGSEVKAG